MLLKPFRTLRGGAASGNAYQNAARSGESLPRDSAAVPQALMDLSAEADANDMQIRATATSKGSAVAHDKSLFSKAQRLKMKIALHFVKKIFWRMLLKPFRTLRGGAASGNAYQNAARSGESLPRDSAAVPQALMDLSAEADANDMQIRATATSKGSAVAHDKSLFSKAQRIKMKIAWHFVKKAFWRMLLKPFR
eukprot:TRINITY_DN6185_c0_g2_i1.p1 TRINITY_DN6185_c0_g2~~TRINITY_DN6185_c0_g2_i1.p1  ORF type:complete len:194 (+),score=39.51 TRINITY_DN6185_c0_g2_i1:2-583(+)